MGKVAPSYRCRELVIRPAAGPGLTPIHHQTGLSTGEPFESNARPLSWLRDRLSTPVALDKAVLCRSFSLSRVTLRIFQLHSSVQFWSQRLVLAIFNNDRLCCPSKAQRLQPPMDTPSQFFNEAAYDDPGRDGYFDTESIPGLKTEPGVDDTTFFLNQPNEVLLAAQLQASKSSAQKDSIEHRRRPCTTKIGNRHDESEEPPVPKTHPGLDSHGGLAGVFHTAVDASRSGTGVEQIDRPFCRTSSSASEKAAQAKKSSAARAVYARRSQGVDIFLQRKSKWTRAKCRQKKRELKDQLMSHAPCNDRNIDLWLEAEARRFAQNSSKRFNPAHGATLPSEQQLPPGAMTLPPDHLAGPPTHLSMGSMPMDPNLAAVTSGAVGGGHINYDHMPDSIFEDTS
ncbi:predicted protein [Verticillium alfalfae VaMs.102]|uniref:Predicted protein n=1 Tax=Verticillium alfalfae (strain VaMs.102 / ATCC MYA-4576 / FGSC 10136) TaxID=526221 RepID=C9SRJ9_VERA1|nr:predicted protein [Verticillium alfalfae VaMs.102]EEY21414.1 predicted protein [Verticillium alfalfae VaMs.102]